MHTSVAGPAVTVDLRQQPHAHAFERVERSLGLVVDRESAVVKRRSVGARSDRNTWVRLEVQPWDSLGTRGWNGVEAAEVLRGVAKPAWYQGVSWLDRDAGLMWRADETQLVTAAPIPAAGVLRHAPELPESWWATFNASLDALATHGPAHPATRHTAFLTQQRIANLITRVFGADVDTTVEEWVAVHGDFAWPNLTAPECWLLDWEDWGAGPRGFDAACLWMGSLAVPELAERIAAERAVDLSTRSGRLSWLYACAGILDTETDPVFTEPARHRTEALLSQLR
ncbi:phosphotransferase [Actinopolyspora sp. H202]|uniref:phosphotransferase n=1 Tax=Actinopolyspora sp. H202 TaxID=1500456 RepID=UPI003EE7C724